MMPLLFDDHDDVLVVYLVGESDPLRGELGAGAPHQPVLEVPRQGPGVGVSGRVVVMEVMTVILPVNTVTDVLDVDSAPEDNSIVEIRRLA